MSSLRVIETNLQGEVISSLSYYEFARSLRGEMHLDFVKHGNSLLDLLAGEGFIGLNGSDNLFLSYILTGNLHFDASRLIGKIAESLVVSECRTNVELNRALACIGRGGRKKSSYLDNFIAIGTGLENTKHFYSMHYQPNDTQRDIIWIDRQDIASLLINPNSTGVYAGLQVKASHSYQYVLNNIEVYHYPVIYFDLTDDFGDLANTLRSKCINCMLVNLPQEAVYLKYRLQAYYRLILQLLNGDITLSYLIDMCKDNDDGVIPSALNLSIMDMNNSSKIILPTGLNVIID